MPIVDLLYHHDNLRPLASRCADVNAIDLLLSACCEVFPKYEALKNKYEKNNFLFLHKNENKIQSPMALILM